MAVRRKYKTPQGYRDGGAVPDSDVTVAIVTPEPIKADDDAIKNAFAAQQRAERMLRQATPPPPPRHELPTEAHAWLQEHPEMLTDTIKLDKLGKAHNYLTDVKGMAAFSKDYFDALDGEFGFRRERAEPVRQEPAQPTTMRRSAHIAAPVTRDIPMASGRRIQTDVTLTPEERIIARNSFGPVSGMDMSDAEKEYLYAQNKARMLRMKSNGEIGQ